MTLSVFSRQQKIYLLPFVVTTILFLLLPYPTESFIGAIFKILPDICLIAYIIMTRSRFPSKTKTANIETVLPEDVYSVFILFGLFLSIFADLFLVVPALAIPGGSIFIIVHICYFLGIELSGRHQGGCDKKTSSFFLLLFINTFLCTASLTDSYMAKFPILVYYIFLFTVAWKATVAVQENPKDQAVLFGCIGACLFIFSDVIVFTALFEIPIPFQEFVFMLTYYGAQFGWAVSTSDFK